MPRPQLGTTGFQVIKNPTAILDFGDEKEVIADYYLEMENFIKGVTGASHVYVFDHTVRNASVVKYKDVGAASLVSG